MSTRINEIAKELELEENKIVVVKELLEDNTIPFIARYRKEVTGGLDEVEILNIQKAIEKWEKIDNRIDYVSKVIKDKGKWTDKIEDNLKTVSSLKEVEDIYEPFKEKKRTKATIAREKGYGEVVDKIKDTYEVVSMSEEVEKEVKKHGEDKREEVEEGIKDIWKEEISQDVEVKNEVRNVYSETSKLKVKGKKGKDLGKYERYDGFDKKVDKVSSYEWLAIQRGVDEGVLNASIVVDKEKVVKRVERAWDQGKKIKEREWVEDIVKDTYKEKLKQSIDREKKVEIKGKSDDKAIEYFSENVESLLTMPAFKEMRVLAVDPAYRTGCKLAVIGDNGKFEGHGAIYPHAPKGEWKQALQTLDILVDKFNVDMIAVGNGTASRETEDLVREFVESKSDEGMEVGYMMVNEDGASVYSASEKAREEFPQLSVEERSAISIGRRLQDPLAELVKIDPKALGVGQYQHDMDQKKLEETLNFTIDKIVNRSGIDVNTASVYLLERVSGLTRKTAKAIVDYREEKGRFTNRKELKKVKGIGSKAYEQAVGFLRVYNGDDYLDETGIHPEDYDVAREYIRVWTEETGDKDEAAEVVGVNKDKVYEYNMEMTKYWTRKKDEEEERKERRKRESKRHQVTEEDVKEGVYFVGVVRNVVEFGAFVDFGWKDEGLVHISKLSKEFVNHPRDVVSIGDNVKVRIDKVDIEKGRIGLSMI